MYRNLGALIGLIGAINNNGKTENTDAIIRMAILSEDSEEMITKIHEEKYAISPNCRTCASPCGNTSDYVLHLDPKAGDSIQILKLEVVSAIKILLQSHTGDIPEIVFKAISYLGYDLAEESYQAVLDELNDWIRLHS